MCCIFLLGIALFGCQQDRHEKSESTIAIPSGPYIFNESIEPRWSSFENLNGKKGAGGQENYGAKGHPSHRLGAGQTLSLLDIKGPGIVNRMWITISNRSPQTLRGLIINMYWDGQSKPAVSVPFGDFFGVGLGKTAVYENVFFANPEGRSFNCYIQMPFRSAARVELVNELDYNIDMVFFDINYQLLDSWHDDLLYFHAYWHRDTATTVGKDFILLPKAEGRGRYMGACISIVSNPDYKTYWWGEGEVKIFLDGDTDFPTLVGTGTEDWIGTAWGQGKYHTRYTGCLIADDENKEWSYYRYHVPDPIFFKQACKVTIQQMGGSSKKNVKEMIMEGADLIPVTISGTDATMHHIYQPDSVFNLDHPDLPGDDAWTNFYRSDDVAAVSYFYLDKSTSRLPEIQALAVRTYHLSTN